MAIEKLQIKHISKSGELLNVINCFPGRITVLRAISSNDLESYKLALAGLSGEQKFIITCGDDVYQPENYTLIGFTENFSKENRLVSKYCNDHGIDVDTIRVVFVSFGLENCIDKKISDLNPDELRRVRLLLATYLEQNILILNNPFEPISSQWREKFAELLVKSVQNNKLILLIISLDYRPQSWIGNEIINRVQVGENTQRTIGFSAENAQSNLLVEQVRNIIKAEEQLVRYSGKIEQNKINKANIQTVKGERISAAFQKIEAQKYPLLAALLVLFVLIGLGAFYLLSSSKNIVNDTEIAKIVESGSNVTIDQASHAEQPNQEQKASENNIITPVTDNATQITPDSILDLYALDIKQSVLFTLTSTPAVLAFQKSNKLTKNVTETNFRDELKKSLESISGNENTQAQQPTQLNSQAGFTPYQDSGYNNDSDLEARREMLREKFRQAIERAQSEN